MTLATDSRVFVAGHRGLVGSAILRRLRGGGLPQRPDRHPRAARPARPGGGQLLVPRQPARVRLPRRRHRRRHPRQLHPAGGVHLRQHDDPRHRGARRPPVRRRRSCSTSAAPASTRAMPAADDGGAPPDRAARADERAVRDRQDRRHQALPGLPQAVRLRLHLRDADEPLRAQRQLRPRQLARAAGADPQVPRREARGAARGRRSGARARRGASSCTWTTSPTPASS